MDIAFFGDFTPFTAARLSSCISAGHRITCFVCTGKSYHRRRPKERQVSLLAPRWSVSALLRRARIPLIVARVPLAGSDLIERLAPSGGELLVSSGFPARIPGTVTALYPKGAINVHSALLPHYRGPHPLLAMVLDGTLAENAGCTVHLITEGFDEGPILAQARLDDPEGLPLEDVEIALSRLGARLLLETIAQLDERIAKASSQPQGMFRYARISRSDITVHPGIGEARLATLLSLSALRTRPLLSVEDRSIPIVGPFRRVGAPNGKDPRLRPFSAEFDISGSRVRARRGRRPWRILQRWKRALQLRRDF